MEQSGRDVPIPVVRVIVTRADGRVLILQRVPDSTGGGLWCLPGGKVDYGDTVEQAVARELLEESGLCAIAPRFLFYQDSLPAMPGQMHCINLYFQSQVQGETKLNDESVDFSWIGPDDLSRYPMTFRNDEALKRYWTELPSRCPQP